MLIMPIVNKTRSGNIVIHNVEVKLKNTSKVKEGINLKSYREGDIIINNTSFNDSIYNTKNKQSNAPVNFLRSVNYQEGKNDFLITTKRYKNANLYDLYSVKMPPKKISAGIDSLYGVFYLALRGEIPGDYKKGRMLSLKKLGIDRTITNEKIELLEEIVKNEKDMEKRNEMMQLKGVSDLLRTVEAMNDFDFTLISKAKIPEEEFNVVLEAFSIMSSKEFKALNNYYSIAQDNKDVYAKLTRINKILYGKPIGLIKSDKKNKVLVKKKEENEAA